VFDLGKSVAPAGLATGSVTWVMKNIILLPLALCAVFLCGCQRSSDTAKIDVLVQDQYLIASNQIVLFNELEAVKSQVAALPNSKQIDSMAYYYHTNALAIIGDRIDSQFDIQSKLDGLILTNLWRLEVGQAK
jgi:hypothetical protein